MLLPISRCKKEIVKAVKDNEFTIVCAETGSGKSTQVPQYLAKHYPQVIITEPRIMAAKTLAKRVSEEMNVNLGDEVGYRTGYDKCSSSDSKIIYCTDGFQLIHTIFNEDKDSEKVLIIDEVHIWNLNIEVLVAFCKFMKGLWNTKVVIMSATLDADRLAKYFGKNVAIVGVPGNLFDVEVEYRKEYEFIEAIKENIRKNKNVLVFVPGKKEIKQIMEKLSGENATILPLHGELDWTEQNKCFMSYGNSKVIVSTNIAQTSITIPDIDVVVDCGKEKVTVACDGIQGLKIVDISIADILQRKGRAGRTKNGKYILCSDLPMESRRKYQIPEIQRSILDKVVLQLLASGLDSEKLEFFHQPEVEAITNAKKKLYKLGAINQDGKVTEIGGKMSRLPVSAELSRMIVEAEKYEATEQVMTISAIVAMGGLLKKGTPYYFFTKERESDLLAELDVWNFIKKEGYVDFEKNGINKKNFSRINNHITKLREVLEQIVELKKTDDRKAIIKSCLAGYASSIFVRQEDRYEEDYYYGENVCGARLNRDSCIGGSPNFIVGTPIILENFQLINFATKIDAETIMELVPESEIETRTELSYNPQEDAVEVSEYKYFAGYKIHSRYYFDYNSAEYDRLVKEYHNNCYDYSFPETVQIDGKTFEVYTSYYSGGRKYIIVDDRTLFTTEVQKVTSEKEERIWLTSSEVMGEMSTMSELRNATRNKIMMQCRTTKRREYSETKIRDLNDLIENKNKIGKVMLTDYRSYVEPTYTFGYIMLKKGAIILDITDDEEKAEESTKEALQRLFMNYISKEYTDKKFSHTHGKKKTVLTEIESEVKKDFDSLVRELAQDLTIDDVSKSLEFIEEYYQDLMAEKR